MASDNSEQPREQQRDTQNMTFVLGRGRSVTKIKIVPLKNQATTDERMKAEQQRKEKLKQQQALQEKRKQEICQQLCIAEAPQVVPDGNAVKLSWRQPELTNKQYSEKLKSADNLHDLLPSDGKITYAVKMTSKDKTVHDVYSGADTCCVVNDLKPGGEYCFSVTASIGDFTATVPSPETKHSLPAEVPSTPSSPKIATKSKSSVTIRWNAPSDNGAAITEYSLEWSKGSEYTQVYSGKEKQHKVVHKFTPGSQTKFRVRAKNEIGWSEFSDNVTYSCAAAAPEAPPTPECVDIGVRHVTVRWSSPDDNGAPITSYKLEMDDEDTGYGFRVIYQGEDTHYSCTDLHRNSNYKFRVCAVNSAGTGSYSSVIECTTLPDLPGCPVNLSSKERPTTTTLHIQWDAPQDDGGSSVTGYRVEICTNFDETFREVYHGETCSCEIKGLSPGTSCKSRVCAISAGGTGPWTDVLVLNTKAVCPDATGKPRVKGKPKQESVTITWDPPQYNGGAVVKFYNVMKKQKDKWLLVAVVQDSTIEKSVNYSYTITKLSPGTTYFFSVVCQNDAGKSANSEALEVLTAASMPDTPPKPFIICNSPTSANVKWEQPVDNGDKIVSYNMKWSEDEDDDSPQITTVTSGRCHVIKNLSPATTYGCSIQAVNSIGSSNWSSWSPFTTPPSSPGAIQHCKVMSKSCSTLVVYWTKPHSNGSPVTAYHIEVNGTRAVTVRGGLTEATLTDLSPQTDYKIRVQSENKVGVGPFSSMALVTTLPLPPAPPTLQLQAANQNSLKLTWHRKQDKGYTYALEMRQTNEKYKVVYEGSAQSHRITRLQPNTTYTFRVCCTNESGRGDWSNPTSFATAEPLPSAPKAFSVTKATSDSLTFSWDEVVAAAAAAGGGTQYELQLRLVSTERDFTQVYKGPLLSYTASSLPASSNVEARVRAIRQATTRGDQLFSPFTDVKHRTLQSSVQPDISEDDGEHDKPTTATVTKARITLTEKQIAFILFTLSVLLTLLVALGIGYWTM